MALAANAEPTAPGPDEGTADGARPAPSPPSPPPGHAAVRLATRISLGVLGLQLVVLLLLSHRQYARFDLSTDFATYQQAVWLITHGHLDPWSSVHSYRFLDDHFALVTWPLALVELIYPHGDVLLYLQDVAGAAAEATVVVWVSRAAERRLTGPVPDGTHLAGTAPAVVLGVTVVLVANPWFYTAMFFDVHTEALAALFLLLALRAAWQDRMGWAVVWCIPLLTCGDLAGLYLVGMGLSLLTALPRRWWWGLGAVVAGVGWSWLTGRLGAHDAGYSGYFYLEGSHPATTLTPLVVALVLHPGRWWHVVWERRRLLYENLIPTGLVGLFSAWSWGTVAVVLVSSVLIQPIIFILSGFQNLAAYVVGLAGSGLVLLALFARSRRGTRVAAWVLGAAILVQAVVFGALEIPGLPAQWISVSPAQAAVLDRVLRTSPAGDQFIVDWGVMGRFADRASVNSIDTLPETIPITSRTVDIVLVDDPRVGDEPLSAAQIAQIRTFLVERLHAVPVVRSHGIEVYRWHPPPGTRALTVPAAG